MPSERTVSSKSPSVMRCTESLLDCPGKSSTLHWNISADNNAAELSPCRRIANMSKLLHLFLVDVLLQLNTGCEFRYSPGGNLNNTARLRIAPVAGLALRNRKCSETDQGHAVAFLQRRRDRIHYRIDRSPRRGFTDALRAGDLVNQVCLVHPLLLAR